MTSLEIIAMAIQSSTPFPIRKMSAVDIRSLSAIGSISCPILVIWFFFLAKYPSKASEIESMIKMNAESKGLCGISARRIAAKSGINATLNRVILLGMLNWNFIKQNIYNGLNSFLKNDEIRPAHAHALFEVQRFEAGNNFEAVKK